MVHRGFGGRLRHRLIVTFERRMGEKMCGLVAAAAVTEILFPARSAFAGHFQKSGEIDLLGKTKGSFRI